MKLLMLAVLATSALGCSDDAPVNPDAMIDAAGDGPDYQLLGEYIDWDAISTTQMRGVAGATWTVVGEPNRTTTLAPNGRVMLAVPGRTVTLTVTKAGYLDARFVADPAVLSTAGATFAARGLSTARSTEFYGELGLTFDPAAAHVLVQKNGTGIPLTLTGGTLTFGSDGVEDTSWVADDTGHFVLFANVPVPASGVGTLGSGSAFTGPTQLPLVAGALTITSIR